MGKIIWKYENRAAFFFHSHLREGKGPQAKRYLANGSLYPKSKLVKAAVCRA